MGLRAAQFPPSAPGTADESRGNLYRTTHVTKTITECRVCGNPDLLPLLDLGEMSLTGVFPAEAGGAVPVAPLELVKCGTSRPGACGLVQLRHSFEPSAMYGENYGYRSGLNRSMVEHLHAKAARIRALVSLHPGDFVLDIGSNDGTLLRALAAPGVTLAGMDPSAPGFLQYYPAGARVVGDFFSAERFRREFGNQRAKVVTSIAMFYDLEAPRDFVRDVAGILADDGIWVFEQSYLPAMLAHNSYDTICHEHLEYYALKQIVWMTERAGLRILDIEFNEVNGGSFSVIAARSPSPYPGAAAAVGRVLEEERAAGLDGETVYAEFARRVESHRRELPECLRRLKREGRKVYGYGASTKGNVLLQYCGITAELLPCIAEVNESKFGAFTPGTHIPIVPEARARSERPDVFLVLPWHFRRNIIEKEREFLGNGGQLLFPLPEIEVVGVAGSTHHRA